MKYCRCERPEYGHSEYCPMVRIEELEKDLAAANELIDRAVDLLFNCGMHGPLLDDMREYQEVK